MQTSNVHVCAHYRPPWMESLPYRTQLSPPPFVTRSHSDAAVHGYLFI